MVIIQAQTMRRATPHLTVDAPLVAPDPMTAPLTMCVVLTGIALREAAMIVAAEAVSIEKPCTGSSRVILNPRVRTIRQPPKEVPSAIDEAARTATHRGTAKVVR